MESTTPVGNWCEGVTNTARAFGADFDPCADVDALPLDRNRPDRRAGREQGLSRQGIAGVFDPNLFVHARKDSDDDVDRLLRSCRDHDLIGVASHGAGGLQVIADGLSKLDRSARVGISKMAWIQRTESAGAQFAPELDRPGVQQRASEVERPLVALRRDIDEIADRLQRRGGSRCRRRRRLPASLRVSVDRFRKIRRHIGAGAVPAGRIAFGEQLLVGGDRSRARHAELRGKLSRRWQLGSRPQASRQDRRPKLQIELAEQWRAARAGQLERTKVRRDCAGLSCRHPDSSPN